MRDLFTLAVLLLSAVISTHGGGNLPCKLTVTNESGRQATVNWINPSSREAIYFSEVATGTTFNVDTFTEHEFQFVEQPSEKTGACKGAECKISNFVVSEEDEQAVFISADFDVGAKVEEEIPEDVIGYCKEKAQEQLKAAEGDAEKEQTILANLGECIKKGIAPKFRDLKDEFDFEHSVRTIISSKLENFTCLNPGLDSTPDVDLREWVSDKDHVSRQVHVKLDRKASRIHVIENFASPAECDAMETVAAPRLHDASVADGKGGIRMSENRKAKQAGITPDFSKEADGDLVATLSRRVYDYVNYALGMNLTEHGQEPLMSIQYAGRGYDDGEPDRYTPHCDGRCDGGKHFHGTRMATMVMYCTIPEKGGHTQFQNAGVHIKPEVGNAIFFSYIDPATNLTDNGLTQHSGCPVYEGEKKIITQWVRYGVNGKERSHSRFNTLGILHAESGDS